MLLGRQDERDALDGLLQRVRVGQSAVLVLRGEAGIGKTALLEHVVEQARGCTVVRVAGIQAEMELAYAGLHQLCAPLLSADRRLPAPQHEALQVAFGLQQGGAPNRFLVALAALTLLADAAEAQPVVCVVDDAQWLDRSSAQVLAFVARRLHAERIAMVFAVREPTVADELSDLPELRIGGLADHDARALLESAMPGPVDGRVLEMVLAEARGNPLALRELPRGLSPAELAGGFGLLDPRPLASRIEQSFVERIRALPPDTRQLLLTAAAEPLGDAGLLWRAAERQGIGLLTAGPAEAEGLIELGTRARFTHPLVRSAVYRDADLEARRGAHAALAAATDPRSDPDRRAWHRAHAAVAPDEDVAAELVRSADRAQRRSGLAAAAAFLQRAAELTPDPAVRVVRALDAAQAKLDVAGAEAAAELLSVAELGPVDTLQRARVERLRAKIVFARGRGRDAPPALLAAGRRLAPLDAALARETFLEALAAAIFAGRLGGGPDEREVAHAALTLASVVDPGPADLLLDGLVVQFTDGYAEAIAPLSKALRAFERGGDERWLWLACRVAQDVWDDDAWHAVATRGVRVGREMGALSMLAISAGLRAVLHVHAGEFTLAQALIDEVDALTSATGIPPLKFADSVLHAARGDVASARVLLDWGLRNTTERGEGSALGLFGWMNGLLYNGNGQYDETLAVARPAAEREDVMAYGRTLTELIEAAVRTDRVDEAADALERLRERTLPAGTPWALGIEARSRALVTGDEDAYRAAIEHLSGSRAALELARARLVYGEWLRRADRRDDAREVLREAHTAFSTFGAGAFAERARRELVATGETVRQDAAESREALTPQESQVARLAREGHTNPEIGAQLFISPRTVEYHLHKVFRKLNVRTRRELRDAPEEALV